MARRCVNEDCRALLLPSEQGALCSPCYFAIITDPGLADPGPQFAGDGAFLKPPENPRRQAG